MVSDDEQTRDETSDPEAAHSADSDSAEHNNEQTDVTTDDEQTESADDQTSADDRDSVDAPASDDSESDEPEAADTAETDNSESSASPTGESDSSDDHDAEATASDDADSPPADAPATDDGSMDDLNQKPPVRRPSGGGPAEPGDAPDLPDDGPLLGILALFDHPERTLEAARATRDSDYEGFDVYTPFPVHGMDEAMGLGRSWIPWVTFFAGVIGFLCANAMQFGMMTFDWPMIIGGKPYAPWPSFVPIMFELTVLIGGVTTGVVMLKAAGCFQEPMILDRDLTDDRFAVWISADDPKFDADEVRSFFDDLDPTEIRGITNAERGAVQPTDSTGDSPH